MADNNSSEDYDDLPEFITMVGQLFLFLSTRAIQPLISNRNHNGGFAA